MKVIITCLAALFMLQSAWAAVSYSSKGKVRFSLDDPNAREVYVAGSFNQWNSTADQLQKNDQGEFEKVIDLGPGAHQYKFVVDGNWIADPDNSKTADDGYGGTNSLVELDNNGSLSIIAKQPISIGIRSRNNPKIYWDGRLYSLSLYRKEEGKDRYLLQKPDYDLNLGMRVKFNQDFEGYTVLSVNNSEEGTDMWKSHLRYKRTYLKLNTNLFSLTAFDRFGMVRFDDPLHLVGSEGRDNYDFGWGWRGLYLESRDFKLPRQYIGLPASLNVQAVAADAAGDDEADMTAARARLNIDDIGNNLTLGGGYLSAWPNTSDTTPEQHESWEVDTSFEFDTGSGYGSIIPKKVHVDAEYYGYANTREYNNWQDDYSIIAPDFEWQTGNTIYTRIQGGYSTLPSPPSSPVLFKTPKPPVAPHQGLYSSCATRSAPYWNWSMDYSHTLITFKTEQEQDGTYFTPSPVIIQDDASRNRFGLGAEYNYSPLKIKAKLSWWQIDYPDTTTSWTDYYNAMERQDGTGRYYSDYTELPYSHYTLLGYKKGLTLNTCISYTPIERVIIGLDSEFAHADWLKTYKYMAHTASLTYLISPQWTFFTSTRVPMYNDEVLGLKTDFGNWKDVFVSNYTGLEYQVMENLRFNFGWGVKPQALDPVSDTFMNNGRRDYLESAGSIDQSLAAGLYGLGNKIRKAERDLMDEKRITIEAIFNF